MLNRRNFLIGSGLTASGLLTQAQVPESPTSAPPELIVTPPLLQAPSAESIAVVWGVNTLAAGYVELALDKDFAKPRRVYGTGAPLHPLDPAVLSVHITNLKPSTRYYYRTVTTPITYPVPYKIVNGDALQTSPIYSFQTPGAQSESSFAVINDTHNKEDTLTRLLAGLKTRDAALTIWNGDTCDWFETDSAINQIILRPLRRPTDHAATRPLLFIPGNHEYRGEAARNLPRYLIERDPAERAEAFASLTRNFAIRQGDIALIGLDTGEDKPDTHPSWAGLANFEPYRALQAQWLAEVLNRPEIRNAPYAVAFCHIPLYDAKFVNAPADAMECYAAWQRQASELWSTLFKQHNIQLLICGHRHRFRYDTPDAKRPWAQLLGGGWSLTDEPKQATLIHGQVVQGRLHVTVQGLASGGTLGTYSFAPRA